MDENDKNHILQLTKLDYWKFGLNYGIVVVVLISYGFFVNYLLGCIESEEPFWSRMILLFSSIEAIAFGAFGYVFGKERTKKIAKTAEEGKNEARKEANETKKELKKAEVRLNKLSKKVIALREAVIIEDRVARERSTRFYEMTQELAEQNSLKNFFYEDIGESRALELALGFRELETQELTINFDYEIKGLTEDEFEYVSIDGDERDKLSGKFYGVPAPGRRVRVEIKRKGNNKTWEFIATSIEDQEEDSMEMTKSLKTSSNSGHFNVKYK